MGRSLLRLALECVWVWSKWFPIDPDTLQVSAYKLTVEKLLQKGVRFLELEYFDFDYVMRFVPDQLVPIRILKECKQVVKLDLIKYPPPPLL